MNGPVDQLARALDATGQLIAGVRDRQWPDSTPCPGWTVRDLVSHIIAGNQIYAGIEGAQPGADLLSDYRTAGRGLLAAFGPAGALERMFTVPFGTVPGAVALHLITTELLVHGWDLGRTTGQPVRVPASLAEQELAFSRAALADLPAGRRPFGPPQPVPADAPAIDRLAALLGRTVTVSVTS